MKPPTAMVAASMPVAKPRGTMNSSETRALMLGKIDHGAGDVYGLDPARQPGGFLGTSAPVVFSC